MGRHLAAPFGSVSRSIAWVNSWLAVMIRLLKVPAGRYVDDLYGAGRSGIRWTGGRCMGLIMDLLGFPMDPSKSENDKKDMVVLGHEVQVDDDI